MKLLSWVCLSLALTVGCELSTEVDPDPCQEAADIAASMPSRDELGMTTESFRTLDGSVSCRPGSDTACVQTVADFHHAISNQASVIVMHPGEYDLGVVPVSYRAEIRSSELWGTVITGSSYLDLQADFIILDGLKFLAGASPSGGRFAAERHGSILIRNANNIVIRHSLFDRIGEGSTVPDGTGIAIHLESSNDVLIHGNRFTRSHAIAIKADDFSHRLRVTRNDFLDSEDFGGAGEPVHLGNAYSVSQGVAPSEDSTSSEFARNFISHWNLERELISVKSDRNRIYENLFVASGDALTIRMGNENEILRNRMKGSPEAFPVRISGERNVIRENAFCGRGAAVSLHREMVYRETSPGLYNSYWAAVDNRIEDNLFIGFHQIAHINDGYAVDSDVPASPPRGNVFAGNLLYSPEEFVFPPTDVLALEGNSFRHATCTCPF